MGKSIEKIVNTTNTVPGADDDSLNFFCSKDGEK